MEESERRQCRRNAKDILALMLSTCKATTLISARNAPQVHRWSREVMMKVVVIKREKPRVSHRRMWMTRLFSCRAIRKRGRRRTSRRGSNGRLGSSTCRRRLTPYGYRKTPPSWRCSPKRSFSSHADRSRAAGSCRSTTNTWWIMHRRRAMRRCWPMAILVSCVTLCNSNIDQSVCEVQKWARLWRHSTFSITSCYSPSGDFQRVSFEHDKTCFALQSSLNVFA